MHDACHTDDGFTSADNGGSSLAAERSRAAGHAGQSGSGSLLEHQHEHEHEHGHGHAGVTTMMLERLSDAEHELHSQQGIAA